MKNQNLKKLLKVLKKSKIDFDFTPEEPGTDAFVNITKDFGIQIHRGELLLCFHHYNEKDGCLEAVTELGTLNID